MQIIRALVYALSGHELFESRDYAFCHCWMSTAKARICSVMTEKRELITEYQEDAVKAESAKWPQSPTSIIRTNWGWETKSHMLSTWKVKPQDFGKFILVRAKNDRVPTQISLAWHYVFQMLLKLKVVYVLWQLSQAFFINGCLAAWMSVHHMSAWCP